VERSGTSRSKDERIRIKMGWNPSSEWGRTKSILGRAQVGGGNGSIEKLYSCFFARARGLLVYIFFFYYNRVLGLIVLYNTVLENSYDNIL
jgi:hypothetical protein